MFNIPNKCKTGDTIFKKLFYENAGLSNADRELFTEAVNKIIWLYCLKPETANINPYKDEVRDYPEIEVLEVDLSSNTKVKRIAEIIMKTIPYPMILVFILEEKTQIWTAHQRINLNDSTKNTIDEFVHTDWLNKQDELFDRLNILDMNMANFYTLYCGFVDAISIYNAQDVLHYESMTGERARELTAKIAGLDEQIARLKSRLKNETQFNRRVEINMEIKKLKRTKKDYAGGNVDERNKP